MKKSTVCSIVATIAAFVLSGATFCCGWHSHEEYVEKTKLI